MNIEISPALGDNYIYSLIEDTAVAVVDPAEAGPVLSVLDAHAATLQCILVTHNHHDHTAGCDELVSATGCELIGPAGLGGPHRAVSEGDTIDIGGSTLEVLETPGHTKGHVSYYCRDEHALWCGDILFAGGCGRIMGSTAATLWASLEKLRALPDETRVYCGHEYTENNLAFALSIESDNPAVTNRLEAVRRLRAEGKPSIPSTLGEEKQTNPFLRTEVLGPAVGLDNAPPAEIFAELRSRKDRW